MVDPSQGIQTASEQEPHKKGKRVDFDGNLRQKQQSKNCSLWCFLAILAKLMNSKLRGTRKNKSQRFKIFRSKRSLRRKFFRREPLIVAYREYFAVSKTLLWFIVRSLLTELLITKVKRTFLL
ncbi:hypothetical protein PV328_004329 [Microctonus aethiopoides]|uniref:Uncharacterized protein n=1 Tax=Microctonus aethiopoides TaxID=144406 RepID=A0AA39FAA0_9HYME|nr:hypothetical protein PV328_004329 [Microctonus aethiopoides]